MSVFVFGIRYIDDIVMRQRDANASGPPEERRYFLTDANYNVAMIVTDAGYGVERVFYTAYGEPEVFPFGDADGDYLVDGTDEMLITAIKNGSQPYNILADLNLDGAVTQADLNAFSAYSGALDGRNVLTASNGSATTGNDIGYAGYTWNDERSQWHVRHREYDPKLGRWLQRDVVEYADGWNRYAYVRGVATSATDPMGQSLTIAGCIGGAAGGAIGGLISSWSWKGVKCGAISGLAGGCCTGFICEVAPQWCVAAACLCGAIGGIINDACLGNLDWKDPCVWFTLAGSTAAGCITGLIIDDNTVEKFVKELIGIVFGLDVAAITGLCGPWNDAWALSPRGEEGTPTSAPYEEPVYSPDQFATSPTGHSCEDYDSSPPPPPRLHPWPPPHAWGGINSPPSVWPFSPSYEPRNIVPSLPPSIPPHG